MGQEHLHPDFDVIHRAVQNQVDRKAELHNALDLSPQELGLFQQLTEVDAMGEDFQYPSLKAIVQIAHFEDVATRHPGTGTTEKTYISADYFKPDEKLTGELTAAEITRDRAIRKLEKMFDVIRDSEEGKIERTQIPSTPNIIDFLSSLYSQDVYTYAGDQDIIEVLERKEAHLGDYGFVRKFHSVQQNGHTPEVVVAPPQSEESQSNIHLNGHVEEVTIPPSIFPGWSDFVKKK